jgi:hypothetical protein
LQQQQQQQEEDPLVKPAPVRRPQAANGAAHSGGLSSSSKPVAPGMAGAPAAAAGVAGRADALASRIMPAGAAATTGLVSRCWSQDLECGCVRLGYYCKG